ncbi:hypothetical protein WMY93_013629 [Mugilogobius chulae]|uniref:Integrase catalytic domain-containing protein n=1 Tax=Mugilogobius chulae TaxID=88201 RepID=A0AAW0P286_9GOBI
MDASLLTKWSTGLNQYWPILRIVHGKPRQPSEGQGSVERANQDFENMLSTWMLDHKPSCRSEGLRFVQNPHEAYYGCKAKVADLPRKPNRKQTLARTKVVI